MARKKRITSKLDPLKEQWSRFLALFPRVARALKWIAIILAVVTLIDIGYLIGIWPEWKWYTHGDIPKSRFIYSYERESSQNPTLPRLRWQTIAFDDIPRSMLIATLTAEDYRFFQHEGIDLASLQKAMEYNWEQKRLVYGASTISQQTVKNLFLSGSRNPFRKVHEVLLTYFMERNLKKKRILEIYLNVAEFGTGIYGIESAARYYWQKSAAELTVQQAIELAATLPAPRNHNPKTRTEFFMKQVKKISRNSGLN